MAFSALSGLRSMAAPALLARAASRGEVEGPKMGPSGPLGRLYPLLTVLMIGEMAAEKTGLVPSRTSAGPLLGRALSGALVAAVLFASRKTPGGRADGGAALLLGALSAVAAAYAGEGLRAQGTQELGLPDAPLGYLEDGLVLLVGKRLLRDD